MTSEQQSLSEVKDDSHTSAIQGYEEVALSEVIDPVLGKTPRRKNDDYWQGDIKWASAKDISQNSTRRIYDTAEYMTAEGKDASNAKKMPEGTLVVIARGATMGRSAQLGEPMTFNQTCYGLKADNSELLDEFLYYAWQYRFNQIQSVSHGTIFDTITMDSFKDIDIPLPSLETQKRISHILTTIDDKIEINNGINETLEDIAQGLFKSWFVDYEPYEQFKDVGVGEIPENFEVLQIGDVCSTRGGGTPSTDSDEYWNGDNLWLTPKEVTSLDSKIVFDTERKVSDEGLNNSSTAIMPEKSVLLTSRATVGEVVVNREPMGTNQGFICIQPNSRVKTYYLACLVEDKRPEIENRASGSTYDEISQTSFNGIQVAVPPKEDIEEFEEKAEEIYEEIYTRELENRRLEELRDTLLPKLMSGEIRVNDIELDESDDDSEV